MAAMAPQHQDIQTTVHQQLAAQEDVHAPVTCNDLSSLQSARHTALKWLHIMEEGLKHQTYLLEASSSGQCLGVLPLALVTSRIFGRFLVSLPFVNSSGVVAETVEAESQLIDRAVHLADELDVRYLELRHEREMNHPSLSQKSGSKVIMRLELPATEAELLAGFKSKLRSQIRSGEKHAFQIQWGAGDCLNDFYEVFCHNMRDLGTPVFPRKLFAAILMYFEHQAELCILRLRGEPVAAALLVHHSGVTEVPSASSLKAWNSSNANMVMYKELLCRAVNRGQHLFDFGRSTVDGSTYRFKKQWGAKPVPSVWQYYVRRGTIRDMRPDNRRFGLAIKIWRHLPVWLTKVLGPPIIRGIP
jgi:FemAB-related protein (PEP-CTERM system-associated)